jgi:hypothetical protein
MTGEEVLATVCSAPVVMGPWQGWCGEVAESVGDRHFFSRFSDHRVGRLWGDSKHACVQPGNATPGWSWGLAGEFRSGFATAAEAIADVDREMRARGWKLIGGTIA